MGYRELQVYERSYKAGLAIYEMTKAFPEEERYGIVSQMRRAGTSIPANIAEGYAKRDSQNEFRRYLQMALGSANEMNVWLDYAKDLGYINAVQHKRSSCEYDEISRMLNRFIQSVTQKSKI